MNDQLKVTQLGRIADALERIAPTELPEIDFDLADAFVWNAEDTVLAPVAEVSRINLGLLRGIDQQRDLLLENSRRFANGLPSNNALLWGARGSGKSSLVKAIHGLINQETPGALLLVELYRDDIPTLPFLLGLL